MTASADLVLRNARVHTLAGPETVEEAVAIRDGRIAAVGADYDLKFLTAVDTTVRDLDGAVVIPGFVDSHTHLQRVGRREVYAELRDATGPADVADQLRDAADGPTATGADGRQWVLGFGYDDGQWDRPLEGADLPSPGDTPVAAFREDMHSVVLNETAFEAVRDRVDADDILHRDGTAIGVVVEGGVGVVEGVVEPAIDRTRELLEAAQARAHRHGITAVHEMTTDAREARAWRSMEMEDTLALRVRLYHRAHALDALQTAGAVSGHGSDLVRFGGIKVFVDGSIGSHTARLVAPYNDAPERNPRGRWVTPRSDLEEILERAATTDFHVAIHAIGDSAIGAAIEAIESTPIDGHQCRIEHLELATDEHLERLASLGCVASMQPNFHRWADPEGLYDRRLGPARRRRTNRLGTIHGLDIPLVLGSDCMPMAPLVGIEHAVSAPQEDQRLTVTGALRAYTGAVRVGPTAGNTGRIEPGLRADLTILDGSPWAVAPAVTDLDVVGTVVAGELVYEAGSLRI